MKSSRVRRILQLTLDRLDAIDDCGKEDIDIKTVSNTYFLGGCNYFLGVSGYDGGYINLDVLETED